MNDNLLIANRNHFILLNFWQKIINEIESWSVSIIELLLVT